MPHLFARRESRARAGLDDRFSPAARSSTGGPGMSHRDRTRRLRGLERPRALAAECDHRPHRADEGDESTQQRDRCGLASLRSRGAPPRSTPGAARILEQKLEAEPVHDGALALAELSYQAGLLERQRSPKSAAWYRDAAVLAIARTRGTGGSRPDLAVRIHNGAVSRLIRASQAEGQAGRPQLAAGAGRARNRDHGDGALPESAADRRPAGGGRSPGQGDGPCLSEDGSRSSAGRPPGGGARCKHARSAGRAG